MAIFLLASPLHHAQFPVVMELRQLLREGIALWGNCLLDVETITPTSLGQDFD